MEELIEEEMGPLNGDIKGTSLRWYISRVHNEFYQLLFCVKLFFVRLTVYKKLTILSVLNSFLFQVSLYLRQVWSVTRHVRCEDDANESQSESLEVVSWKVF